MDIHYTMAKHPKRRMLPSIQNLNAERARIISRLTRTIEQAKLGQGSLSELIRDVSKGAAFAGRITITVAPEPEVIDLTKRDRPATAPHHPIHHAGRHSQNWSDSNNASILHPSRISPAGNPLVSAHATHAAPFSMTFDHRAQYSLQQDSEYLPHSAGHYDAGHREAFDPYLDPPIEGPSHGRRGRRGGMGSYDRDDDIIPPPLPFPGIFSQPHAPQEDPPVSVRRSFRRSIEDAMELGPMGSLSSVGSLPPGLSLAPLSSAMSWTPAEGLVSTPAEDAPGELQAQDPDREVAQLTAGTLDHPQQRPPEWGQAPDTLSDAGERTDFHQELDLQRERSTSPTPEREESPLPRYSAPEMAVADADASRERQQRRSSDPEVHASILLDARGTGPPAQSVFSPVRDPMGGLSAPLASPPYVPSGPLVYTRVREPSYGPPEVGGISAGRRRPQNPAAAPASEATYTESQTVDTPALQGALTFQRGPSKQQFVRGYVAAPVRKPTFVRAEKQTPTSTPPRSRSPQKKLGGPSLPRPRPTSASVSPTRPQPPGTARPTSQRPRSASSSASGYESQSTAGSPEGRRRNRVAMGRLQERVRLTGPQKGEGEPLGIPRRYSDIGTASYREDKDLALWTQEVDKRKKQRSILRRFLPGALNDLDWIQDHRADQKQVVKELHHRDEVYLYHIRRWFAARVIQRHFRMHILRKNSLRQFVSMMIVEGNRKPLHLTEETFREKLTRLKHYASALPDVQRRDYIHKYRRLNSAKQLRHKVERSATKRREEMERSRQGSPAPRGGAASPRARSPLRER